jgi:hypothetical protein
VTSRKGNLLDQIARAVVGPAAWLSRKSINDVAQTVDYRSLVEVTSSLNTDDANKYISDLIRHVTPSLVARLGRTELMFLLRRQLRVTRSPLEKIYAAISRLEPPFSAFWQTRRLQTLSGFYPLTKSALSRFSSIYLQAIQDLNLLGSWVPGENHFSEALANATVTGLGALSPIGNDDPWTKALAGKRVLVVHPFSQSIQEQYPKRRFLFDDPDFLPEFDLTVVEAVQSLGKPSPDFRTWFDALDHMTAQCLSSDFDVALIACGAYGLPLGARLKHAGKVAIVLGGALQLLFGIRGQRWDSSGLYNEYWVRPLLQETPSGAKRVEGGAYW